MKPLSIAVVGAGPMGRLHARAILRRASAHRDCELSFVIDRHLRRSERVAAEFGGEAIDQLEKALGKIDAAVVAIPTASHAEIAMRLLEAGSDVLIEKPMAQTLAEANALAACASRCGRILGVGHVEWFNPTWRRAVESVSPLHHLEIERLHPKTDRGLDIDVIQDFMLHDLDWVRRSVDGEVVRIEAEGRAIVNPGLDEARVEIEFSTGVVARFHASRVHSERSRVVRAVGAGGTIVADLLAAEENALEPLDAEWADFLSACHSRETPGNSARVGIETLELVERVRHAITESGRG